jgi:hypothetical protein
MTSGSALLARFSSDTYLSDESVKLVAPTRKLLCVVPKRDEPVLQSNLLADRFQSLAKIWHEECGHLSSVREMVIHPAYQQIVGMGQDALPFIFSDLERETDHWFWALRAITGDNPVPAEHQGNMTEMAKDWLWWAKKRGIRW